mmetsp:Transcript_10533/g.18497  ORF Transcript_10533/g.18497 Transcript_10533/m.18497 type:complete len:217 (-) Transcript_10533:305-955(-)
MTPSGINDFSSTTGSGSDDGFVVITVANESLVILRVARLRIVFLTYESKYGTSKSSMPKSTLVRCSRRSSSPSGKRFGLTSLIRAYRTATSFTKYLRFCLSSFDIFSSPKLFLCLRSSLAFLGVVVADDDDSASSTDFGVDDAKCGNSLLNFSFRNPAKKSGFSFLNLFRKVGSSVCRLIRTSGMPYSSLTTSMRCSSASAGIFPPWLTLVLANRT